jgi:Tfp pilus assembly protein FimT
MVVMGVIALMTALVVPAMNSLGGAGDISRAASDISDVIQQARSYAMAHNTYVYFGIKEVDSSKDGLTDGQGRLAVAILVSRNGERSSGALSTDPNANNAAVPISKLLKFDNVHLTTSPLPSSGGMARETDSSRVVNLASSDPSLTKFTWPSGAGTAKDFDRVMEFDPQGVARVQTDPAKSREIKGWIEIPIELSHGGRSSSAEKNVAAIQVDGMTGSVRVFRP